MKGLETTFFTDDGGFRQLIILIFHVKEGEILGIVGESGCGKSVTSLSIMGLSSIAPPEKLQMDKFYLKERFNENSEKEMRKVTRKRNCDDFPGANDILKSIIYNWKSVNGSNFNHKKIGQKTGLCTCD